MLARDFLVYLWVSGAKDSVPIRGVWVDDTFSYEVKADRGHLMVYPKGDLDISTVEQLDRTLDDWMVVTYESITFDCRQVDFVDSSFLRYLVNLKKRCDDIRITNPSRTVLKIIQICGLDTIFLVGKGSGT